LPEHVYADQKTALRSLVFGLPIVPERNELVGEQTQGPGSDPNGTAPKMNLPCSTKVRSRRELRMDGITMVKYDGSPERPLRIAFGRQALTSHPPSDIATGAPCKRPDKQREKAAKCGPS
jgi:hypothetical protein